LSKSREIAEPCELYLYKEPLLCSHCTWTICHCQGILESINHWLNQELNEEDSNAAANNNNNNNIMSSPYALVLREALESGLMTEEEYAEAVQEAQRVGSKSPEEKKEIEDYNEAF